MLTPGFFEVRGAPEELQTRLRATLLKGDGFVYFADFGEGTIKVGMTRGIKARISTFWKTADTYGKDMPQRFGISPVLTNHEHVEKLIHKELSPYWIERELFQVTERLVDEAASNVQMNVLRSCMWPGCAGYFNHYGKKSVKPRPLGDEAKRLFVADGDT